MLIIKVNIFKIIVKKSYMNKNSWLQGYTYYLNNTLITQNTKYTKIHLLFINNLLSNAEAEFLDTLNFIN